MKWEIDKNDDADASFLVLDGHYPISFDRLTEKDWFMHLREFRWNDYFVKVGLAGLHRNSIFEFTGSMRFDDEVSDDFVTFEDSVPIFEREMSR